MVDYPARFTSGPSPSWVLASGPASLQQRPRPQHCAHSIGPCWPGQPGGRPRPASSVDTPSSSRPALDLQVILRATLTLCGLHSIICIGGGWNGDLCCSDMLTAVGKFRQDTRVPPFLDVGRLLGPQGLEVEGQRWQTGLDPCLWIGSPPAPASPGRGQVTSRGLEEAACLLVQNSAGIRRFYRV